MLAEYSYKTKTGLTLALLLVAGMVVTGCDQQPQEPAATAASGTSTNAQPEKTASAASANAKAGTDSDATDAHAADTKAKTLPPVLLADVKKIIAQAKADDKILVIDFWATWCAPCVQMFPELHEKLPALGDNVRVVTITLDSPGKYEAAAVDFLRKHDAMHDAYRIGGESDDWNEMIAGLGKQWQDMNVPAILVYNTEGELWDEFINERAKPDLILRRVEELVNSN